MAMTEEERRAARNAASKRWYAAHKAAKKTAKAATPKAGAKQKPAKKAEAKPARAKKAAKKAAGVDVQKNIDKLVKKNEKVASAAGVLLKEAASILADVYKTGDQKLIDKTTKLFARRLSIAVEPDGDGRMVAKFAGAKAFRVPKQAASKENTDAVFVPFEPDAPAEEPKEISVDPSLLTGVEDGTVTKSDLDAQAAEAEDEDEDSVPDEDEDEKDPEDMDDEEYEEYRERQAEKETDEFFEGRAETMRELEEQGAYDD